MPIQAFFHGERPNTVIMHLYCKNTEIYSMAISRCKNDTVTHQASLGLPPVKISCQSKHFFMVKKVILHFPNYTVKILNYTVTEAPYQKALGIDLFKM